MIVIKYKANDSGGIDSVELNYNNDAVYVNNDLDDSYESVEDYLAESGNLYDSLVECALAVEARGK